LPGHSADTAIYAGATLVTNDGALLADVAGAF
jgi:hypothetical protein